MRKNDECEGLETYRLRDRAKTLRPELDYTAELLEAAADEIDRLRKYLRRRSKAEFAVKRMPDVREWGSWKAGCPVCGLGSDGKPMAYACARNDCPTRVTCA